MVKDVEKRLATLETLPQRLDRIVTYMEKGEAYRVDTSTKLGVIINNQDQFREYMVKCDTDRAGHDKRIGSLETSRTRQYGIATGVSLVITTIGGALGWLFGHGTHG